MVPSAPAVPCAGKLNIPDGELYTILDGGRRGYRVAGDMPDSVDVRVAVDPLAGVERKVLPHQFQGHDSDLRRLPPNRRDPHPNNGH